MDTTGPGLATIEIRATARKPFAEGAHPPIQDETSKRRWFVPDEVVISYVQEITDPRGVNESVAPLDVTAVVSGTLITSGATGRRRTSVTFRRDEQADTVPDWLRGYVEDYMPSKLI